MIRARRGKIPRPLRDSPLKMTFRFECLDLRGKIRHLRSVEPQQSKYDIANLVTLIRWNSHIARHLWFCVLGPSGVASDRHHDWSARFPIAWFQFLHELD